MVKGHTYSNGKNMWVNGRVGENFINELPKTNPIISCE